MGGSSVSASMVCMSRSAIWAARRLRVSLCLPSAIHAEIYERDELLIDSKYFRSCLDCRSTAVNSGGGSILRTVISGCRRNLALAPRLTLPPACIFLLTIRKWTPSRVGNNDVRKAKPLISPVTLSWPRFPQVLETSNGTRAMVQLRLPPPGSRTASKVFTAGMEDSLAASF